MKQQIEQMETRLEIPGAAMFQGVNWGDYSVMYVQLKAGVDATPLLKGLPNDKCPCPHWGYIVKGAIHVTYTDGTEETCRGGEVFYWPTGHTVRVDQDTAFVEFSPTRDLRKVYDHIEQQVQATR
jgi:hypothetical protein